MRGLRGYEQGQRVGSEWGQRCGGARRRERAGGVGGSKIVGGGGCVSPRLFWFWEAAVRGLTTSRARSPPAHPLPSGHLSLTLSSLLSASAPKASWSGQRRPHWPQPPWPRQPVRLSPRGPLKETQEWDKLASSREPSGVYHLCVLWDGGAQVLLGGRFWVCLSHEASVCLPPCVLVPPSVTLSEPACTCPGVTWRVHVCPVPVSVLGCVSFSATRSGSSSLPSAEGLGGGG